ncbi:hypothetical protein JL721_1977 [Aureococcus anophagefferens]|nr:hypothetical protein JL721_1977 [Aureococcus anophagefferens]
MTAQEVYLTTLDALSRMRDKCDGEISLPQLCVVGDQSSGKSSLLECLTKVPFPVKSGICTRAPTVVQCRRADQLKCEIRRGSDAEFEVIQENDIEDAIAKAQKNLIGTGSKDGRKVTGSEIALRMEGPDQMDLQIVDLPGIIHYGDGATETKDLIEKYIASSQTLILLVRILTKFDIFDSDDSRLAAMKLVNDQLSSALGPHAVVCREDGDKGYDEEGAEKDAFDESAEKSGVSLPASRAAIVTLKDRLPDLFTTLVRKSIPALESAARSRLAEKEGELRKMGTDALTPFAMLRECQRALAKSTPSFEVAITPAMEKFQEAVHDTGEKLTEAWLEPFMETNAFESPFFQGEKIYLRAMEEVVSWWKPPMTRLLNDVKKKLSQSMRGIQEHGVGVSKRLSAVIEVAWEAKTTLIIENLEDAFNKTIEATILYGTANHYIFDKYLEQQIMPDDEDRRKSIREHVAKRCLNAIKAVWAVEKKSVTDNMMKNIRDLAILERNAWIDATLLVSREIHAHAYEDDDVGEQRANAERGERVPPEPRLAPAERGREARRARAPQQLRGVGREGRDVLAELRRRRAVRGRGGAGGAGRRAVAAAKSAKSASAASSARSQTAPAWASGRRSAPAQASQVSAARAGAVGASSRREAARRRERRARGDGVREAVAEVERRDDGAERRVARDALRRRVDGRGDRPVEFPRGVRAPAEQVRVQVRHEEPEARQPRADGVGAVVVAEQVVGDERVDDPERLVGSSSRRPRRLLTKRSAAQSAMARGAAAKRARRASGDA